MLIKKHTKKNNFTMRSRIFFSLLVLVFVYIEFCGLSLNLQLNEMGTI